MMKFGSTINHFVGLCGLVVVFTCLTAFAEERTAAVNEVDVSKHKSLQSAFDSLGKDGGGVVRIPPGVYEISEPLRISADDVLIEGAGSATHIKNTNTEGKPAIVIEPPKGKKTLWRVKLANLRLTGNEKSGDGVVAKKVDEFFAEGITVSYHGGDGIKLDGCYEDPRICDSLFSYNKKVGLNIVKCHDIVVSANHFEENQDAVRCVDGFNLCMNGNNLDDHLRHGVIIENTYGSVVTGNMIEECQGTGIILDRDCYGITLSANVIAHDFGGGIDLRGAHGCAVSANTFAIVPKRGLVIGPKSGRITVTGNNFSDSYLGKGREKRVEKDRAASGIVLDGTSDIAISGNVFSGLDTKAVDYDPKSCRQVVLTGNVITECAEGEASVSQSAK
jgi:hypothetical protein